MKGHCCLTPVNFPGSAAPPSFHIMLRVNPEGRVHALTWVKSSLCVTLTLVLRSERLFFLRSYLAQFLQDF